MGWSSGIGGWERTGAPSPPRSLRPPPARCAASSEVSSVGPGARSWPRRTTSRVGASRGEELPTARFVCLRRDPLYLAQSLLKACRDIQGSSDVSYGIDDKRPRRRAGGRPGRRRVCARCGFTRSSRPRRHDASATSARWSSATRSFARKPTSVVRHVGRTVFGFEEVKHRSGAAPATAGTDPRRRRVRTSFEEPRQEGGRRPAPRSRRSSQRRARLAGAMWW